jgi:NAD-dependent dihydropyrimidine dehydrogenase PreA subunit
LPPLAAGPTFNDEEDSPVSISIDQDLCEATGVCATVCPDDVFKHEDGRTEVVNSGACIYCWLCVENCTSGAVEID